MANEKSPHISREQMEAAIKEGGSVLYMGKTITTLAGLPSEAELAVGDPDRSAAAESDIDEQIAKLQAQKAALQPEPVKAEPVKAEPVPFKDTKGISAKTGATLAGAGIPDEAALKLASDDDLAEIEGIDVAAVKAVRDALP